MGKQFHFLVAWDEDTQCWYVDDPTCVAVMTDGTIYDNANERWMVMDEEDEARDATLGNELRHLIGQVG